MKPIETRESVPAHSVFYMCDIDGRLKELAMSEFNSPTRLPPVLTDGVIVLDSHTAADAEAHWAGEDNEMIRRFEAPYKASVEHIRGVIQRWREAWASGVGPGFTYAMRDTDGVLMGGCEVRFVSPAVVDVSYWTYPAFRGRGLAARATALLYAAAASVDGVTQVEAHVDADNMASRRVAEKNGFIEEGTVVEDAAFDGPPLTRVRYVRAVDR